MLMNSAVISALAAVCGSSVGAVAPVLNAYIMQRNQVQRDLMNRHNAHREALYSDFITQASRLYADSIAHSLDKLDDVVSLCTLGGRETSVAEPSTTSTRGSWLQQQRSSSRFAPSVHKPTVQP